MNGCEDDREVTALARYRGIPNTPHAPGEKSRWRRFLEWAMPWLRQKWAMGEAVLEARVTQEQATARKMMAEAAQAEVKVTQDMLQTIALARKLEQEKLGSAEGLPATPEELEEEMEALLRRLDELGWKHGTRISFSVEAGDDTFGLQKELPMERATESTADAAGSMGEE